VTLTWVGTKSRGASERVRWGERSLARTGRVGTVRSEVATSADNGQLVLGAIVADLGEHSDEGLSLTMAKPMP
jgi:hypothetical protein